MACSREPTSRMYALKNGIVVQVVAMVLAGGLRRATHGFENIKYTAKRTRICNVAVIRTREISVAF